MRDTARSLPMHFSLLDRVLERSATRIVSIKHVSAAEEYLQDHFPSFPVLPGVLMLEALVQAARNMLEAEHAVGGRTVLGQVRALKYGAFVRPGGSLRVEVELLGTSPVTSPGTTTPSDARNAQADPQATTWDCRGQAFLIDPQQHVPSSTALSSAPLPVAVSGRFTMRGVCVARASI